MAGLAEGAEVLGAVGATHRPRHDVVDLEELGGEDPLADLAHVAVSKQDRRPDLLVPVIGADPGLAADAFRHLSAVLRGEGGSQPAAL
jgi:hypothetical protein